MENKVDNKQKISAFYNLNPMKMTQQLESYLEEDKLYTPTIKLHNSSYIFGIEVEVENIHTVLPAKHKAYWDTVVDNSLRNSGLEFVSKPLKAFQIEGAIDQLHTMISKCKPVFSARTSTHVHMNVRDLQINQIYNLILIYTSVENVLFNWVGHNRDKNIFCIKLTDTNYFSKFSTFLSDPRDATYNWNKYTALNVKPIESKGTIEFRHLYGTADKEIILRWINFLSCMKTYAKNKPTKELVKEIQELNTNSMYEEYLYNIFGVHTKYLMQDVKSIQEVLEDSITYVKLSTLEREKEPQYVPSRNFNTVTLDDLLDTPPPTENAEATLEPLTIPTPTTRTNGGIPNPYQRLDIPQLTPEEANARYERMIQEMRQHALNQAQENQFRAARPTATTGRINTIRPTTNRMR